MTQPVGPNGGGGFLFDGTYESRAELQGKAEVSKYPAEGETDCIKQTNKQRDWEIRQKLGREDLCSQNDC